MSSDKVRYIAKQRGFYFRLIEKGEIFALPKKLGKPPSWAEPIDGYPSENEKIDPDMEQYTELGIVKKRKRGEE